MLKGGTGRKYYISKYNYIQVLKQYFVNFHIYVMIIWKFNLIIFRCKISKYVMSQEV